MKRRLLIAGAVLAVVAVAYTLSTGNGVEVDVAAATRDTLSVTIPVEGRTQARDRFTVAAPISGRLTRLEVEEGDSVGAGQVVGRLYPAPEDPRVVATVRAEVAAAEARHTEAEARLREAELQASQAVREVDRRRPLAEMGALTREAMEQAELAATVAEERSTSARAALASAEAALRGARARLLGNETTSGDVRPVEVTAPVSGRVVRVPDRSERVVLAGTTLLELADTGGLEVVMDVLSEDAVSIGPGDELVVTGWGGEGTLRGRVRAVTLVGYTKVSALGVEEQRVDVYADLHDRPGTLGTGYRVSGEIVVWRGADVLTVPASALFRSGAAWELFVVEGGRARQRTVQVGHRNEDAVEIVEGLEEGDRVILFPPESIEDGASVSVTPPA
jgi:HlyD family secretion protein